MPQGKKIVTRKKTVSRRKNQTPPGNPFMLDVVCAIALMIALFTGMGVHNYYQSTGETAEFFGIIGGAVVQGLVYLFGRTALVFPLFLAIWGVHLLLAKRVWNRRVTGIFLLALCVPVFYSLYRVPRGLTVWEAAGYGMGGGYVGAAFTILLTTFVGQIGSTIVLLVVLFIGAALIIQRPVSALAAAAWGCIRQGWSYLYGLFSRVAYYEEDEPEKAEPISLSESKPKEDAEPKAEKRKKGKRTTLSAVDVNLPEPEAGYLSALEMIEQREGGPYIANYPEEKPVVKPRPVLYSADEETPVSGEQPVPVQDGLYVGDKDGDNSIRPQRTEKDEPRPGFLPGEKEPAGKFFDRNTPVIPAEDVTPGWLPENVDLYEAPPGTAVPAEPEPIPYQKPSLMLLAHDAKNKAVDRNTIRENSRLLEQTLAEFGIRVKVEEVVCGPAVTRYEMSLAPGTKVSKIVGLSDDLQMRMAASGIRIEAPIPGKSAVGIELPNRDIRSVGLYDILASESFAHMNSPLAFALGEDITGRAICSRLKDMPHLLIAGSTGSGKSVCINCIIMSILFNADPEEVKLVMVDPKMVELTVYNNLPHLMTPVVTDPKKASQILKWMTVEMEKRYKKFAGAGVRDINRYREVTGEAMPYIVIIIDELADLMMVAPGEVEDSICRLAQMARAAGMHLIVATQRPSVDVVTGIIKANIPSRIAFAVSSQTDSRTILDMGGAEKLLGKGDMLFFPVGASKPQRVQGAFVSDDEIEKTVTFITQQNQNKVQYNEELENLPALENEKNGGGNNGFDEEMFLEAVRLFVETKRASASLLQRRLHIGFVRATDLMELMEKRGVISPVDEKNPRNSRKVLVTEDYIRQLEYAKQSAGESN